MLHRVRLAPVTIESYREVAPSEQIDERVHLGSRLRGLRVAHIDATPCGGGVSALLRSSVALEIALGLVEIARGLSVDWLVIAGDSRFFGVTKALHNGLQGAPFVASADAEEVYLVNNRANAAGLSPEYDVIVVHDPQPAAMRVLSPTAATRWIWRCHIDTSQPYSSTQCASVTIRTGVISTHHSPIRPQRRFCCRGWRATTGTSSSCASSSCRPSGTVLLIFSRPGSIRGVPRTFHCQPRCGPLPATLRRGILDRYGVVTSRPLVVQVSRFDPWKDPFGVIRVFRRVRDEIPGVQLTLLGPMVLDDPEGWRLYDRIQAEAGKDADSVVGTNVTGISYVEVNDFQHSAWVVVQESSREGFGLVVSEAMWKETPVVAGRSGGIALQMADGEGGFLVDLLDGDAFVERVLELLRNRELARVVGQRGRVRVRENFLVTRCVRDELRLFERLVERYAVHAEKG